MVLFNLQELPPTEHPINQEMVPGIVSNVALLAPKPVALLPGLRPSERSKSPLPFDSVPLFVPFRTDLLNLRKRSLTPFERGYVRTNLAASLIRSQTSCLSCCITVFITLSPFSLAIFGWKNEKEWWAASTS